VAKRSYLHRVYKTGRRTGVDEVAWHRYLVYDWPNWTRTITIAHVLWLTGSLWL